MTARLPWQKNPSGGFITYPEGEEHSGRRAIVWYSVSHPKGSQWRWTVGWDKWFRETGLAATKQAAADAATEAWWRQKQTPIPRDIEGEIEAILAALLTKPPPSDLLREDGDYLRRLMHAIRLKWERDLRRETAPCQVMDLIAAMSEELYARRLNGEQGSSPNRWSVT